MKDLVKRGRHPADPTGEVYGDTHWPLPTRYDRDPTMYVAINRETMTFLGRGEYRVLWAKATGLAKPEDIVIGEAGLSKTYSPFTDTELKLLHRNSTGLQHEGFEYGAMLQACKAIGLNLTPEEIPSELVRLPSPATDNTKLASPAPKPLVAKPVGKSPTQGARPKPGTATGRIWEVADQVYAQHPDEDMKFIRAEIIRLAVAEGINQATVQVQYGKWKGSINMKTGA